MKFIWKYLKPYKKYIFTNLISALGFILIQIGIPTLLAMGINNHFMNNDKSYVIKLGLGMIVISIIGLIALIVLAYSTNKLVVDLVRDIRNDLFRKTQSLSKDEYDELGISRLITNVSSDAYTIMQFLIMVLRTGIMAPMMFITSLVMIFSKSTSLGLITLLAIPVMLITMYFINKVTKPLSEKQQEGLDGINLQIRESLSGLRMIRGFNNEDFMADRFDKVSQNYANLSKKMFQTVAFVSPIFTLIFTTVIVVVMHVGSRQVQSGVLEYGTLVAFIEYVFHALMSFLMLAVVLMMYPRTSVAVSRIEEVIDIEPSIQSKKAGVKSTNTQGYVEFENVCFAYSDSAEKSVLKNISFTAKPGETVAFIGSTGSGKSTLMKLIPRLVDVTEGRILVDGVDIRDYDLGYLRSKMGYVPQKSTLFSGTIKENILFGNSKATDEEIDRAVDIAQAKEFISSKEEGYERMLSEGGTNLSGGQRQRLCIARALIRDVPMYIFDDSFSALDYKTDSILRKRLKKEVKNATMFIVAQRISTVVDADKILVLNEGEIVGVGTHKELLKSNEIYYQIASSQLTEEELNI